MVLGKLPVPGRPTISFHSVYLPVCVNIHVGFISLD